MKNFLPYLFVILYLLLFFVPLFGAVDFAGPQWLYLSVLNILFLTCSLFSSDQLLIIKSKILYSFLFLSSLAFLSLLYSINISLWLHDFFRLINVLVALFLFSNIFMQYRISFYNVSIIVYLACLLEAFFSLSPLIVEFYHSGSKIFSISNLNIDALKGVTGNRNITTASIVVKLPFIFYAIFHSRSGITKLIFSIFLVLPALVLFLISSRAALLSFIFILFSYGLYTLSKAYRFKKLLFSLNYLFLLIPVMVSYLLSINILPSTDRTALTKVSQIRVTNESSSNRFELWSNALDYIYNHPIIGAGLGNWKVESAQYWGSLGENYLVPFHAHNDFLEYSTELGVIGGLAYLLIYLFSYRRLFSFFNKYPLIVVTLFCSLSAYFIDAFFNFPFERPIMQVMFVLILSLIVNLNKFSYEN